MIKVVKQKERIPNVVRCLGSPTHKYAGSLGVVVLVVGFSICLQVSIDNRSNKKDCDQLIAVRRGGFYTATRLTAGMHIYTGILYATCQPVCEGVIMTDWIPDSCLRPAFSCSFEACLSLELGLLATIASEVTFRIPNPNRCRLHRNCGHTAHRTLMHATIWHGTPGSDARSGGYHRDSIHTCNCS
jgi:hypothetical protein